MVLSQLTRYLIENDTEALDFLLSHQAMLKQYLGKDCVSVSTLVHGFEFDEALELLLQKTRPQP